MNLKPLLLREAIIRAIRTFFYEKAFHEVIPPMLNRGLPLEPNLYSFSTNWQYLDAHDQLYLPTSPESALKKMLAAGIGNCFALGKSFRNRERSGTKHNPEFMMLEWYREDATYDTIMQDVQELIAFIGRSLDVDQHSKLKFADPESSWPQLSIFTLFNEYAGIQLEDCLLEEQLFSVAANKGYAVDSATWSEVFDQLFLNEIEPQLPKTPFFLIDFPARTSPLCMVKQSAPQRSSAAERFELYLDGVEIGNGNTEQTDAAIVRAFFEDEALFRKQHNLPAHPIDEEFLSALETLAKTGKSYAGIGIGVDRLALYFSGETNIAAVEPFVLT